MGVRLNPGSFFCRIDKWEVANLTLGTVKTYGFSTFHSSHKDWVGFERNGGSKQMVDPCLSSLKSEIFNLANLAAHAMIEETEHW